MNLLFFRFKIIFQVFSGFLSGAKVHAVECEKYDFIKIAKVRPVTVVDIFSLISAIS